MIDDREITSEEMAYCFGLLTKGNFKTLLRYGNTYISGSRYEKAINEYMTLLKGEETKTYMIFEKNIHDYLVQRVSKVLGFEVNIYKHHQESGYFIEKK